jgi:hypothetical protein
MAAGAVEEASWNLEHVGQVSSKSAPAPMSESQRTAARPTVPESRGGEARGLIAAGA